MPLNQFVTSSDRALKAEFHLILNAVVEGICGLDARGNATFCNDALLKMLGYQAEEIVGKNVHKLLHPSRTDPTGCQAEECTLERRWTPIRRRRSQVNCFWRKDGTCFPTECRMRPQQRPSSLTCQVLTVNDITAVRQARDMLRQSEEKFRRILESAPDVASTSDRNGRTIYISPKAESVLGYTTQEIYAGGTHLWLGQIHAEDFGRVNGAYAALFEKQGAFDQEYRIRRKRWNLDLGPRPGDGDSRRKRRALRRWLSE